MKYFVISDIHAHFDAMQTALQKAQYDPQNPTHHLLVLGDLFDRGHQTIKVLDFLYPLHLQDKATIILGNHDSFLLDFLEGDNSRVMFNAYYNGFDKTVTQLSGLALDASNLDEIRDRILERYSFLLNWLKSFPYYYEISDYVFVHGGIDGGQIDWKLLSNRHDFIWSREINLPRIPNKTVVAGHHRVATIRQRTDDYDLLFLHHPEMFDILYTEGKILIDRFVEVSNEINVLILDL